MQAKSGISSRGIKDLEDARVGDTVTGSANPAPHPLPGYQEVKPMVFAGLYPVSSDDFENLRSALEKLHLNDASLSYEPETSTALGFGFRCGFLGLLHMEIIQERLDREFDIDIITTVPNVEYRVRLTSGEQIDVQNPAEMPPAGNIEDIAEPMLDAQILVPSEYVGNIMRIAQDRRGHYRTTEYIDPTRALLRYDLPLSEIVLDFYDRLKSVSRGYASFDYEYKKHQAADLVKLDLLINGEPLDALSAIVHRDKAYEWGRALSQKLKALIPRQLFEVVIQAAIGAKVISRETVRPFRKNVTAKMLRRRYYPQAQTPRASKRGQKAHETSRRSRNPSRGVSRCFADGSVRKMPPKRSVTIEYIKAILLAFALALFYSHICRAGISHSFRIDGKHFC